MKQYHIFKDSTLFKKTSARKRAISMIRQAQEQETHYLLRAEFSIIHGEEEVIFPPPDGADKDAPEYSQAPQGEPSTGRRFYILKDGMQYGSAPTRELALLMIGQAQEHREESRFSILCGMEEFIRYPRRGSK